ncbi:MAG: DUF1330 domain-containing protein [Crocinitomicaceae bacterium]|nr:DUF1330 domain-containing protein [Crocinitomicaceae bacterium]
MEDQKAIMVITAIVNKENIAELPSYLEQIQSIFGKNGARPVGRYKTMQDLAGTDSPEIVSITEFDNAEIIKAMVESDEFTDLAELRARVFSKLNLMICGV